MTDADPPHDPIKDLRAAMQNWKQGDFTMSTTDFPVVHLNSDGIVDVEWDDVRGWIVVSQTCDIVNVISDQDTVVVAPIVKATEELVKQISLGTTTVGALIENAADPTDVADLRFLTSVRKSALAGMERQDGFNSDVARATFVTKLERRYGRFAFPDDLSNGPVITIRNRAKSLHQKDSENARVYKSLRSIRVAASPNLDTPGATIQFFLVLNDDPNVSALPKDIVAELEGQAKTDRFAWPADFNKAEPLFRVVTMDGMTAREWDESRHVDLDFISWPKA